LDKLPLLTCVSGSHNAGSILTCSVTAFLREYRPHVFLSATRKTTASLTIAERTGACKLTQNCLWSSATCIVETGFELQASAASQTPIICSRQFFDVNWTWWGRRKNLSQTELTRVSPV